MSFDLEDALAGCLVGTAIGDALGLVCEGLSRERQWLIYPDLEHYHFFLERGMVSDDTEHTCMVAQALISAPDDPQHFTHLMAWKLRFWLLGLPVGTGLATLKACLRLWLGIPPQKSGVFSAGNGPAMRAAILGVVYGLDFQLLREYVRASTRITHTDPRAEYGAMAVALAAWMSSQKEAVDPEAFYISLKKVCQNDESDFIVLMRKTVVSVQRKETIEEFVKRLNCEDGVSGFIMHTVPVVIHIWLTYQDNFRVAVLTTIRCGGDTDTTAAIMGAIMGARVGYHELPEAWVEGLMEWPRSVSWMRKVAYRLARVHQQGQKESQVFLNIPVLILRNLIFLVLVLLHGFRRLLPPY